MLFGHFSQQSFYDFWIYFVASCKLEAADEEDDDEVAVMHENGVDVIPDRLLQ